jgi:hypothetical protein
MNIRRRMFAAFSLVALLLSFTLQAQNVAKPVFSPFTFQDGAILTKLSKNGHWALAQQGTSAVETGSTPKLVNLLTSEVLELSSDTAMSCTVNDVTNDGNIVVGEYGGQPAYWSRSTGEWTTLPVTGIWNSGIVNAVTPDGKRAVGTLYTDRGTSETPAVYMERPYMWDLTTGKSVSLTNLPTSDMLHISSNQRRFTGISPDGRYALGCMSFSYIMPAQIFQFIYDTEEQSYKPIGFTAYEDQSWVPDVENVYYVDNAYFSPDGAWVTGTAYIVETQSNSDTPNEYEAAYRYNVATEEFEVYNYSSDDYGMMGIAIDNDGVVYGATPAGSPIREMTVRSGNYWFTFSQILSQYFGMDFADVTGYDNTGTPISLSEDGLHILSMVSPLGDSYVVELPLSLATACSSINLLSNYTASPASGSVFSTLSKISLTFDRDIEVLGKSGSALLLDSDGKQLDYSGGFAVNGANDKELDITFFPNFLEDGKTYSVVIPAGTLCVAGDKERTNNEIVLTYIGRANESVKLLSVYPADGTQMPKIDYDENPMLLTFNTTINLADDAVAYLYRDDQEAPIATLNMAYSGARVAVYPASTQYLFSGSTYTVVIPAGSVTDIVGRNGCEEYRFTYVGTYERTISQEDRYLFHTGFDDMSTSLATFMLYEGDHNTPVSDMTAMEFDADNTPWNFSIRDNSYSSDYCAASHSCYTPAGKSDDWMVIPQIYIPDTTCQIRFDAQSYHFANKDTLRIIVFADEEVHNVLTDALIQRMKTEGELVFCERLTPGQDEESLDGDWTSYLVTLKQFAGKSIYIAFVNQNEAQSMIFVDNIYVERDMKFSIALSNDDVVVAQSDLTIAGTITIESAVDTYTEYALTLKDQDGNIIDEISATGVSLTQDDKIPFSFGKKLPLKAATVNSFQIDVRLNDYTETVKSSVQNNAFRPTKRVVLEEMTGVTCVNCPLGILAIEHLREYAGDQFIPISIHTYTGDPFGSGLSGYTNYLGLSAAPSGIIQRNGVIASPMYTATGDYLFTSPTGDVTWMDYVQSELQELTNAEISATLIADTTRGIYSVNTQVNYAINASNLNLNILTVVMEDNLTMYQQSNLGQISNPNLGEFGLGGKYSGSYSVITHDDVVRSVGGMGYAGTGGLLPQTMTAGEPVETTIQIAIPGTVTKIQNSKVAVMLIDANTGALINACVAHATYGDASSSGIESIGGDNDQVALTIADGILRVTGSGQTAVELYSLNGQRVASAAGVGQAQLSVAGERGIYLVRIHNAQKTIVKKIVLR